MSKLDLSKEWPIEGEWEPKIPHDLITLITSIIARQKHTLKTLPKGIECGPALALWLGPDENTGPLTEMLKRCNSYSWFNRVVSEFRSKGKTREEESEGAIFRIVEHQSTVVTYTPQHPSIHMEDLDKDALQSAVDHGFIVENPIGIINMVFLPLEKQTPLVCLAIGNTFEGQRIRDLILVSVFSSNQ
jgi:hypothetical protein